MADDRAYLRRVAHPDPLLQQLAEQAVDLLERWAAGGATIQPSHIAAVATDAGVPIAYVLDAREARNRRRAKGE